MRIYRAIVTFDTPRENDVKDIQRKDRPGDLRICLSLHKAMLMGVAMVEEYQQGLYEDMVEHYEWELEEFTEAQKGSTPTDHPIQAPEKPVPYKMNRHPIWTWTTTGGYDKAGELIDPILQMWGECKDHPDFRILIRTEEAE